MPRAKSSKTNLLVGANVLIDYNCRWEGCKPEYQAEAKAACSSLPFYDQQGIVVAVDMGESQATVLLNESQTVEKLNLGFLRFQSLGDSAEQDMLDVLQEIRDCLVKLCERED